MAVAVLLLEVVALFLCYPEISVSSSFCDENPIQLLVSDNYNFEFQSSSLIYASETATASSPSPRDNIKAIYQFGDSISDTGNYIRENPHCKYANLPYGETFFHKPTGRTSNGLLMIDYISTFFNLPLLDPYLKKDGNFSHGVNFAVAGACALNGSTLAKKGIQSFITNTSLLVQLDWFKSHLNSICSTKSECKEKLASSLIMMGEIGGNDYNWALLTRKVFSKAYEMVPKVVQVIKNAIKEVIKLGAIHIVVPGNFPVGCMAVYLATFETNDAKMYDELKCLKHLNEFAEFHNDKLQQVIEEIRKDHPNVTIVYADYFLALKEMLRHATSLGFDKDAALKVCCGTGNSDYNFDTSIACGTKGVEACKHPYKHISWDGYHLTQHAYQVMANWLIKHNFQTLLSPA